MSRTELARVFAGLLDTESAESPTSPTLAESSSSPKSSASPTLAESAESAAPAELVDVRLRKCCNASLQLASRAFRIFLRYAGHRDSSGNGAGRAEFSAKNARTRGHTSFMIDAVCCDLIS